MQEMRFYPWVGKIPWSRKWQPTPVFLPGKIPWTRVWPATVYGVARVGLDSHSATTKTNSRPILFPKAAVTNDHKSCGLNTRTHTHTHTHTQGGIYSLTVQEPRSLKSSTTNISTTGSVLRLLEDAPYFSLSFWWLLAVLGVPWLTEASFQFLPPSSHHLLLYESVCQTFLSFLLDLDLGSTIYPRWSHFKILITSANALFQIRSCFQMPEFRTWMYPVGVYRSPTTSTKGWSKCDIS